MPIKHRLLLALALLCASSLTTIAVQAQPIIPEGLSLAELGNVGDSPVAVRHAGDDSGRLFIVRQEGDIVIYADGALRSEPFLDIRDRVAAGGERGLLGLAFHPDFTNNGRFYVNYTRDASPGRTVIAGFQANINAGINAGANADRVDPSSEQVILEIIQDASNHNGGDLHFGPDGYLYIATGDGGGGGDPLRRSQDLTSLLGKLLRINVDVETALPLTREGLCGLVAAYLVPNDNPFASGFDGLQSGFEDPDGEPVGRRACAEIIAYGLRNPWRFSFDRDNGDIFMGDVGQDQFEEISLLPAGAKGINFGWRCFEADSVFDSNDPACARASDPHQPPIIRYSHDDGRSVTGGFIYRGGYAPLRGRYLYADFVTGKLWFARRNSVGDWDSALWPEPLFNISSFGEDQQGELYIVTLGGQLYRLQTPD